MRSARLEKQVDMNGAPSATHFFTETARRYDECKKKEEFRSKVYFLRNSMLTDLMALNHLQTVHNISIAIFLLLVLNMTLYYIAAPNDLSYDVSLITWGMSNMKWFFIIWTSLHISCIYVMFPAFALWTRMRSHFNKKITDTAFLFIYISYLILTIVVPAYFLVVKDVPPITTFATLGEQMRLWMKTYSFVRENVPKVLHEDSQRDREEHKVFRPNREHFIYFLFAPTVVYREYYPKRSEQSIRWGSVLSNFLQFWCSIFIIYCSFVRFTVPVFSKACRKKFLPSELVFIYAGCMFVGALKMFMMFYGFLHCWFNIFAEMLQFGDRQFYQDWWNSTSFSQYYRKWNGVVYDWLYTYIHTDIYKLTNNRVFSMVTVFLISAVFHEYIITLGFGFFYPVLCVVYSTVGVSVVFLTQKRSTQQWNIFMWFMLFSGWGVLEFLYSFEWYARANTPRQIEGPLDYFVPRTWSCNIIGEQPT